MCAITPFGSSQLDAGGQLGASLQLPLLQVDKQ